MTEILAIVLVCFFSLMCCWLLVATIQKIVLIVFDCTGRLYLSPFIRCESSGKYFVIFQKKQYLDTVFGYCKYRGRKYFIGLAGVYRLQYFQLKKTDETDLSISEKLIIDHAKKSCTKRALSDRKILNTYISQYENQNINDEFRE